MEFAAQYKLEVQDEIAVLQAKAERLTGKEHQKERKALGKAIAELRGQHRYIDACRVLNGLEPLYGHFLRIKNDGEQTWTFTEAARVAAEVESALSELEPPKEEVVVSLQAHGLPEDVDALYAAWKKRIRKLEVSLRGPVVYNDVDELEQIAKEVVDYKERLRKECGYNHKDLKDDNELQAIEGRLDVLAAALLGEPVVPNALQQPATTPSVSGPIEANASVDTAQLNLKTMLERERRLTLKLTRQLEDTTGLSPSEAKEVERLSAEIVELKATLRKDEGLTEHEQDKDERVFSRFIRLTELRRKVHHDKKHDNEKHTNSTFVATKAELEQLRTDLEALKRQMRLEQGCTQKDVRNDPDIASLEERLSLLNRMGGA